MDFSKFITALFVTAEKQKIRSRIIPIKNVTEFTYQADITKPYSFEIVNTGTEDMFIDGIPAIKGANANSMDTSLNFPRVGTFKRNDIIKLTNDGAGNLEGFIREDLEFTG